MSTHEYASGNGVSLRHFNGHQLRGYSMADAIEQQQLLKDQTRASLDLLLERIGAEKYLAWVDEAISDTDSLGVILMKADDYLARLSCGDCPFDFDPGMCGVCQEHGLGVK